MFISHFSTQKKDQGTGNLGQQSMKSYWQQKINQKGRVFWKLLCKAERKYDWNNTSFISLQTSQEAGSDPRVKERGTCNLHSPNTHIPCVPMRFTVEAVVQFLEQHCLNETKRKPGHFLLGLPIRRFQMAEKGGMWLPCQGLHQAFWETCSQHALSSSK